jgi:hypothetical protein
VSDRDDIADVLVRYATGIDSKNSALLRSCFTDDLYADYGNTGVWEGGDAITKWMDDTHRTMPATNHMISNVVVAVDGDHATATSYVHAVLVINEERTQAVDAVGTYHDVLVRTAEGWKIRERRFVSTRQVFL